MKKCRACGTKNEKEAARCSKCGIEFPQKDSPLQSARKHFRCTGFLLFGCGFGFCLAVYFGLTNGSIFRFTNGTMAYPAAGHHSTVLTIIFTLGLMTAFLIPEFVRSRRAYEAELKRAENKATDEK
jgi:uncharacterized membrane protein YciS (DUF1049 family)